MKIRHIFIKKFKHFEEGRKIIEQSIKNDPENIEIIFLRYLNQRNSPWFLNYNQNLAEDYDFLIKNLKFISDPYFKNVIQKAAELNDQGVESSFALIGVKAANFFKAVGGNVVANVQKLGDKPDPDMLIGLTKTVLDLHKDNEIDQVYICSNKFVNTMTQQPGVQQLIPLPAIEDDGLTSTHWDYIYEPEAKELLEGLMTRYIESLIYHAVVENNACEQAAKMLAMKNATENAGDLIKELELLYNNVRQAAITQELSEIVGGAAAV